MPTIEETKKLFHDHGGDLGLLNKLLWLTHDEPDSLTKIAEDVTKEVYDYWNCASESCDRCPATYEFGGCKPREYYAVSTCVAAKDKQVSERIEKLAKKKGVW